MPSKTTTPDIWVPEGFERYREAYPATPAFTHPDAAPTRNFAAIWREFEGLKAQWPETRREQMAAALDATTFVIIRGFLGNCMPGNSLTIRNALRTLGFDAFIANNRASATVAENAKQITQEILRRVPQHHRLVFLGHSKGGLESLHCAKDTRLMSRVRGVIMSQTPRGPSAVLESLLLSQHQVSLVGTSRQWAERLQRFGLGLLGVEIGGRELTREALAKVITRVDAMWPPCSVLQTASWSSRPTAWLDSFHERLEEIRPGCAHDGQFYVEDLIWPNVPHVLLPHVDHAQPVMGGFGFDSARYWLSAITLLVDRY